MLLTKLHTLVVEYIAERTVIVTGKSHFETESICNLMRLEHCSLTTLINRDYGLVEPSLLLQVSLEGCKEVCPQFTVFGR